MSRHVKEQHHSYPNERDRYFYDFGQCQDWAQYDTSQDACYFGIWVNPDTRQVLTFAEGDETVETFDTPEEYHAALAGMAEFYGSPPPFAKSVDMATGQVTEYYEDRPV